MDTHRERELKFDVDERFALPDMHDVGDHSTHVERRTVRIVSTYYDTDDGRLLAAGLTLRQREGDVDVGWQLKVPTGSARTEISLPPQAGPDVPGRLLDLLAGVVRGQALRTVAVIRSEREQNRLMQGDELLLEVADDRVHGTALGEQATITSWRELEAEVGPAGDERLLQQVARLLRAAGAEPAELPSKLAKTLGIPAAPAPADAHSAVTDYAQQQWRAIVAGDIALRRGLDSVHKTRVAVRRFRSMLRVLGPVLDRDGSAELDAELSWYQDILGQVRDLRVQRTRLADHLAALPPEDVLGPVAGYIEQSLLAEQARRREVLAQALDSPRYLALLDQVATWAAEPPVATDFGGEQLRQFARKATRKARRRLAVALEADDPALLHRARKAAKRARYATELAAPVTGKNSKRQIKRLKRVQDVLGEYQDSIVARQLLRRLATAPQPAGDQNAFTLGLLFAVEQAAARDARAEAGTLRV